jgi:hypothetical protein
MRLTSGLAGGRGSLGIGIEGGGLMGGRSVCFRRAEDRLEAGALLGARTIGEGAKGSSKSIRSCLRASGIRLTESLLGSLDLSLGIFSDEVE